MDSWSRLVLSSTACVRIFSLRHSRACGNPLLHHRVVPTSVHLAPSDRSRGHLQEAVLSPDFFAFPDFRYTCALIIVSFFRSLSLIHIPATPFSSRGPARFCHRSPPCSHAVSYTH